MVKFKHKNGGICEVETIENITRLRKDSNYKEISENKKDKIQDNKSNGQNNIIPNEQK